ncbi:bifunctional adenosylcobinamide kinase/adenosylcobinamide-phosphate guanylyltransferase [Niveibacterium terrae]|uniref:bifunctional adenosylcobinamide kinase/adenosylcobinamide-phosphate guanylyltransferase n=1 Tax=Niveibacterium terrae TaxID=3373598 RepID=UPI003A8CCAA8
MIELILGGARSGKSRYACEQAQQGGLPVHYLVTAEALDDEMAQRISRHRGERPAHWLTVEAPLALAEAITAHATAQSCLIVDCLTLWLSNQILGGADEDALASQREALCAALAQAPGELLIVSNEVGLGLVPETPLGRAFRDAQGRLNQAVAAVAQRVVFIAAGLPLCLKG